MPDDQGKDQEVTDWPGFISNYTIQIKELRQALQELLHAAEQAGNCLPGGIPEGLMLQKAISKARRFA